MIQKFLLVCVLLATVLITTGSLDTKCPMAPQDAVNGAWVSNEGTLSISWVFIDQYMVMSMFDKTKKEFVATAGGPYRIDGNKLTMTLEFNTTDSSKVGQAMDFVFSVKGNELVIGPKPDDNVTCKRVDNGNGPLAGNWQITGRLENGQIVERKPGPRRTLKILSGTRFQWIAINPEVKGFYGTGGGTYTFANGKYTENIEFFSRDNSRVGSSLTFDGKVESGAWHHSGLSSRGESLNEIWKRGVTN